MNQPNQTEEQENQLLQALKDTFEIACAASNGRLRLAVNEEDETTDPQPEAATFLKLDDKRCGRDLELYRFMSHVSSIPHALADVAEVVMVIQSVLPDAYAAIAQRVADWANLMPAGDGQLQHHWREMWAEPVQPAA